MTRTNGPFDHYVDEYAVDGDDIRARADEAQTNSSLVTALASDLRHDADAAGRAVEGDLATLVRSAPAATATAAHDLGASGTFAVALLRRFAADVDAYDRDVDTVNADYRRRVAAGTAPTEARQALEPDDRTARRTLDDAAAAVARSFRQGPDTATLTALWREGLLPLSALSLYPALQLSPVDLALGEVALGLPVDLPEDATPTQVAAWWQALGADQRATLLAKRPELVGGTDGIPAADRDAANRSRLPGLVADAQAYADAHPDDAAAAEDLKGLQTLAAMTDATQNPAAAAYQLLLLDSSGHPLKAALSNGDVDGADIVSTWVGGTTSTVAGFPGDFDRMQNLGDEVHHQLLQDGDPRTQVGVLWLGYDAPDDIVSEDRLDDARSAGNVAKTFGNLLSLGTPFGDDSLDVLLRDGGDTQDAINTRFAHEGGTDLASFLDGVAATNPGAEQSASAHSYGGAVLGEALHHTGAVDTAVVSGAPGVFADDVSELHGTHLYVSEAQWSDQDYSGVLDDHGHPDWGNIKHLVTDGGDFVPDLGHADHRFGADPSDLEGAQVFDDGARDTDGRHLTAAHGHSSYWDEDGSALYNEAAAVVGDPERIALR